MHWDQQLEDDDDAASDDDDLDQGEAFDYRVDDVPAFSGEGADVLRLPHGLMVVPTPWNGEAALDGARVAMRFRRGAQGLTSNSKLVKWSDGSFTLQVGSEVFPVTQVPCVAPVLLTAAHDASFQNALDGDNWLGVTQDTEHILLQSRLRNRYKATTVDEAQVSRALICWCAPFCALKHYQALRLIKIREESAKRQAQLEERIIAPENDDFAPFKGKGARAASIKRARPASSRRFTSNLTPGDLDGKYKNEDEEDLSAVCVPVPRCRIML